MIANIVTAPPLKLDRLLETCYRREATALVLTDGVGAAIWMGTHWRTLKTGPISLAEITEVKNELTYFVRPTPTADKGSMWTFNYGKVARFQAHTLEHEGAACLMIRRIFSDDEPR